MLRPWPLKFDYSRVGSVYPRLMGTWLAFWFILVLPATAVLPPTATRTSTSNVLHHKPPESQRRIRHLTASRLLVLIAFFVTGCVPTTSIAPSASTSTPLPGEETVAV